MGITSYEDGSIDSEPEGCRATSGVALVQSCDRQGESRWVLEETLP